MKKVMLPSGAELEIQLPAFAVSRNLYMAIAEELKTMKLDPEAQVDVNFIKDIFLTGISSKKIDLAMKECLKHALYNNLKVSDDLFEPAEARQDYIPMLFEVAVENVLPFLKSLYAQFADIKKRLENILA